MLYIFCYIYNISSFFPLNVNQFQQVELLLASFTLPITLYGYPENTTENKCCKYKPSVISFIATYKNRVPTLL